VQRDLDPKGFDVYAIMAHQGKTLRVLVSKARSYFFISPNGLVSFRFLKTNHAQISHAPEKDTTEDNTTVWSLMNFLVLLWVGNFDYIWYKIIDHGGIGRYETRVFPDGHPREGEIYIIIKDDRSRGLSESLPAMSQSDFPEHFPFTLDTSFLPYAPGLVCPDPGKMPGPPLVFPPILLALI